MTNAAVFRIIAYAAYYLFTFRSFSAPASNPNGLTPQALSLAYTVIPGILNALPLLVFAALSLARRQTALLKQPAAIMLSGVLCSIGSLFATSPPATSLEFWMEIVIGNLFAGLGTAVLFLALVLRFMETDTQRGAQEVIAGFALNIFFTAFVVPAESTVDLVINVMLPILCALFVLLGKEEHPIVRSAVPKGEEHPVVLELLVKLGVYLAVLSFAHGLIRYVLQANGAALALPFIVATLAILVVVMALLAWKSKGFRTIHCTELVRVLLFAFLTVGVLMFLLSSDYSIAYALRCVAGRLLRDFLFIMCLQICATTAYQPVALFGGMFALSKLATLVAGFVAPVILATWSVNGLIALYLISVAFAGLFVFNSADAKLLMHKNHTVTMADLTEQRANALAEQFGLTAREREVVAMYCQGHSVKKIADELALSESTIGTYRRKIYDKVGVHSKQDLIDLFGSIDVRS